MAIRTPGKHYYSNSPIAAMIKWRRQRRSRKSIVATLMLTSMIDVFAVLVLFLLQNFSATGEVLFIQKDIRLPAAQRSIELERSPVITISKDKITLEGEDVGESFTGNLDKLSEENWEIKKLTLRLEWLKNAHYKSKNIEFPGKIIIQADKELPFVLIKRVMFTCTQSGYYNINFAVMKEAVKKEEEKAKS